MLNLLIGAGIAVALLLGWFLGVSPIFDQITAVSLQTNNLQQANAASSARLVTLKKQFANIGELEKKLEDLQDSIPADADIPGFLAEINALCAANGVSLTSLTVNDALAYVAPGAVVAPATPDPSATPGATVAPGVTDPSTGLIAIPVKVTVSGPYSQVMAFAGALQTGKRLLLVAKLTLTGSASGADFTGDVEGNIYGLPLPPGTTPNKATPSPTPTPAPTPTPTVSPTPSEATPTPEPTNTAG